VENLGKIQIIKLATQHKNYASLWYDNNVDGIIIILIIFRDTELNYG
jgi:hypothetical protein